MLVADASYPPFFRDWTARSKVIKPHCCSAVIGCPPEGAQDSRTERVRPLYEGPPDRQPRLDESCSSLFILRRDPFRRLPRYCYGCASAIVPRSPQGAAPAAARHAEAGSARAAPRRAHCPLARQPPGRPAQPRARVRSLDVSRRGSSGSAAPSVPLPLEPSFPVR